MFYDYFKYLCKQKGVSVNKACQEMGLSRNLAAKWKSTNTDPSMSTLQKISTYFSVSIDNLLAQNNKSFIPDANFDVQKSEEVRYMVSEKDKRFLDWFNTIPPKKRLAILIAIDAPEDLF